MKKEDVRSLIVTAWLALPAHARATEAQAVAFAAEHENDHRFKATGGRAAVIVSWLRHHLPEAEARRGTKISRRRGRQRRIFD